MKNIRSFGDKKVDTAAAYRYGVTLCRDKLGPSCLKNKAEYSALDVSPRRLREGVTDLRTDNRTVGRTDEQTLCIEMRGRI